MRDEPGPAAIRRGGRPSKQDAERLGDKILTAATALFLANGYGATSVEAVAERAGISKRTFYHRFADKADLFGAVMHRIIQNLDPTDRTDLFEGDAIESILRRVAPLMLHAAVTPAVLGLHRLVVAEATRFPDLAAALAKEGAAAAVIDGIAKLLEREIAAGRMKLSSSRFAAEQFMQMVIAVPQRRALGMGTPMTAGQYDAWADDAVTLFLHGCLGSGGNDRFSKVVFG